jgi:hypothetical protein
MGVLALQKIIFTNSRGQSLVLSQSLPFILSKVDGLGDVQADNQTQRAPFQDGTTYIDTVLSERFITLEIGIFANSTRELSNVRQQFSAVFNPKLGEGLLQYVYDGEIKEIQAIPEHVPTYISGSGNRMGEFQKAMLTLKCPNPYWKSPQVTEEPTFEALFQFPFEGEFEIGVQRDERTILNDGDSPTPLEIEFYGLAVNPIITNKTTGEFIKVNRTIAEGEYMRIDTTKGRKRVEFISSSGTVTNVFNWIDLESTLFELVVGENVLEYSADNDIQGAIVNIRYNKLYNAV